MNLFLSSRKKTETLATGSPSCVRGQRGSVLFYIFLAIGLLAALSYSFVKDSRQNMTAQLGGKMAEELYVQANVIRSAIMECVIEYPNGGPDVDANGVIQTTENPNNPFPVNPTDANNPEGVQADDSVRNISCTGAPAGLRNIFQGTQNKGRFLPPPPSDFGEWTYINDADGVRVQIIGTGGAATINALDRLSARFSACQSDVNYSGCGATCFSVWIHRSVACP